MVLSRGARGSFHIESNSTIMGVAVALVVVNI